jgi:peptidoglycan/LPS O-acetylase OafA/YrhL
MYALISIPSSTMSGTSSSHVQARLAKKPMRRLLISPDQNRRANNFNAIRLAMALLVVWSHCFALSLGSEKTETISQITNGHYNSGNVAVLVFFVISGFLICESYQNTANFFKFIMKRVRRIYPGYMVATSVAAFVIVPLYSSRSLENISVNEIFRTLIMNLALKNSAPVSDVFSNNPSNALNGSLWSIPFEFWCYIGIAALGVTRLLPIRVISVVVVAITMSVRAWLDVTGRKPGGGMIEEIIGWPYLWFSVLPCFMLGVIAFLYRDAIPRSRALLIVLVIVFLVACYAPIEKQTIFVDALFPPTIAYVVFYFAFSKAIHLHNVAVFGDFSYGLYLYAFPIQQMILASLGTRLSFLSFVGLSLLLSLVAGILSWYLVERWFLMARNQALSDKR